MENKHLTIFFDKLRTIFSDRSLIKLVLSNRRDRSSDLKSIIITIVEIKKGTRLNFVYRHETRDVTRNYDAGEALGVVKRSLGQEFLNADLFSTGETFRLLITHSGKVKTRTGPAGMKPVASFGHDHVKQRIIPTQNNIYLKELGILNSNFEVRREMSDKYLQVNRYIELLAPFIGELSLPGVFHVADMGSGKAYLTFALYDYLTGLPGMTVVMTGVESRKDLVKLCSEIAVKAGFDGLKFISGTIRDAEIEKTDMLVALHACDTATDDAIFRGITSGAGLIVCAPCCHKQVRKEFNVTNELKGIIKHGILEERQAEIITDGIRALVLEAHGYRTKVFEFISTEHTPKNVMIVGQKIPGRQAGRAKSLESIRKIRELFGIKRHYLEELFETQSPGKPHQGQKRD